MKKVVLVLAGASLSSGVAAGVLLTLNLLIWAILTAWIGSAIAFIGFGLIAWALQPKKQPSEADVDADAEPAVDAEQPQIAVA